VGANYVFNYLMHPELDWQVLINYTRGRNIIVSSAASRVNELRGPNDVANMSTLFGLSMEHARAAVSKNCRYEWVSCFNGNDGKWILDVNKSSEWFYLTKFHMFSDKIVVIFLVFFSSIDVNKIV
jgi:hypothetical protein